MSTKIYDGVRFNMPVRSLMTALTNASSGPVLDEQVNQASRWYGNMAVRCLDRALVWLPYVGPGRTPRGELGGGLKRSSGSIASRLAGDSIDRTSTVSRGDVERRTGPSLRWSVTLFPRSRDVLGIVYAENRAVKSAVVAATGATDFHYQNQCDRPDDVSAAEWSARKRAWSDALRFGEKDGGVPADYGLTYEPVERWHWRLFFDKPPRASLVLDEMTHEERSVEVASSIAFLWWAKDKGPKEGSPFSAMRQFENEKDSYAPYAAVLDVVKGILPVAVLPKMLEEQREFLEYDAKEAPHLLPFGDLRKKT